MDEQLQGQLVKVVGLGKGQCFAHKASQALAQGVMPAFDVRSLSGFLANGAVRVSVKGHLISLPEIAAGTTGLVALGDEMAQSPATVGAAVADEAGDDLSSSTTEGNPDPALVALFVHKCNY